MQEIKHKINQINEELKEISVCLYQQKLHEGYSKLNNTLVSIIDSLDGILSYARENNILMDEKRLNENLNAAMLAMEDNDAILLADILTYEITEQLKEVEALI